MIVLLKRRISYFARIERVEASIQSHNVLSREERTVLVVVQLLRRERLPLQPPLAAKVRRESTD